MGIVVPVPLPAGHDAVSVVFSSRERRINPVREPAVWKRKGPATGDQSPWREQVLRSGEWGSSVRLGVGTSVSRDRGEGLIEAESSGGFRLVAPNPAAGRLASEAAAFPQLCCLSGVQCSCFPGDETRREIRDRQQIQGETSRDELWFPTREGKVVDASTGFAVCFWSAHDSAVRTAHWMGQFPAGCQIKSVSRQGKRTSERASQSRGNGFRNKADRGFQGFSSGTSFFGPAY